jgi:hypothetical protein
MEVEMPSNPLVTKRNLKYLVPPMGMPFCWSCMTASSTGVSVKKFTEEGKKEDMKKERNLSRKNSKSTDHHQRKIRHQLPTQRICQPFVAITPRECLNQYFGRDEFVKRRVTIEEDECGH